MVPMQINCFRRYSDLSVDELSKLLVTHRKGQVRDVDAALFGLNSTGTNVDGKTIGISSIDLLRRHLLSLDGRIRIIGWTLVQREIGRPACESCDSTCSRCIGSAC